jgi:flagellar basal-body rod protein FlgG
MLQGLYAAAAGMEAQQTQLDALSNDIANADTPGYQQQIVGFHDLLYSSGGYNGLETVPTGAGAAAAIIGRNQSQGTIQQTGNPLDIAIQGEGYLEARQPDGTIGLTRNGALSINASGQLTTKEGMVLQPPITIPAGDAGKDVTIGRDGTVSVAGSKIGQIAIVTVPAPDQLLAAGNSMFTATAASGAIRPAAGATIQQGALEQSNVDMAEAMTQMIQTQESYNLASKAIQFETQMGQIASTVKQ